MKHCLITGAADGIGKALAARFAAAGYAIIGIDIDVERAAQTQAELARQGSTISFIQADLSVAAEVERVVATLASGPAIDVCVHNAGISAVGRFASSDLARQQTVLDINLRAPLLLTAGLLKHDTINRYGTFVFISSLSFFASYPGAAVYAASKDGLASYARSLQVALARRPIHVLTVYPGPTRTAHARRYSPDNRREQRRMLPEQLAALIYRAVETRRRVLVPGTGNRVFAVLGNYAPRLAEWMMGRTILAKLE